MDEWYHALIKDSGSNIREETRLPPFSVPLLMECQKALPGLQAEEAHIAKTHESMIKG